MATFDGKKRVVLYGIGYNYGLFMQSRYARELEIVALVDKYKNGVIIDGYLVQGIDEIKKIVFDEIFVLPVKSREIKDELINLYGIDEKRIKNSLIINKRMISFLSQYQYVIVSDNTDYLNYPYLQLGNKPEVCFFMPLEQEERLYFDSDVERCINTNTIFIIRDHIFITLCNEGLIEYIKKGFPCSRWVAVMSDMCDGDFGRLATRGRDYVLRLKNEFELVITYHSQDANKYGLTYLEQTYPSDRVESNEVYDVLFVGAAKNRLDYLHSAYYILKEGGIDCRFWISHVEQMLQLTDSGIVYNKPMSYSDYLKEVGKCKCIIEVCQLGNESTYRYDEAVVNNKKFLFNDRSVLRRKYYNERYMLYFNKPEDIDVDWIRSSIEVDYMYNNDYSPSHFLEFIDTNLKDIHQKP